MVERARLELGREGIRWDAPVEDLRDALEMAHRSSKQVGDKAARENEHSHLWTYDGSPIDGISEYFCKCGAAKQVILESTSKGNHITLRVFEIRIYEPQQPQRALEK